MRIGVTFPQNEITADPVAVRDYAQAAEGLGYTHLLAYDHVVGADITNRPDWRGPYTTASLFHEPFVLFGYLAGLTTRLEFVPGVIILPQRQTVLVAKQAAEVDVLTGGQFRLGIGVGWNEVEYEALNEDFRNRGKRSEEQIAVLRALFTNEVVTFHGKWHHVEAAGLNPMPVQRPIPIWIGGSSEATLKRVGEMGDGWFPQRPPDETAREMIAKMREYARAAGRDPLAIGLEARVSIGGTTPDEWARQVEGWRVFGATHLSVNTMKAGLNSPQEHIDAIRRFKEAVGA
ncbi:MAG: LLM class F420-dependent oxidoreductase [Thermomicrobia bacterium]|nr:LLM class F420-dependent oxidoreductase [Thermomicrobia bacterium]MCA1723154.1 LLM class F420-dependent oxidoreductase [Thermomicrobia bacterium]